MTSSTALAKKIANLTLTKKASDVVIMDLRTISPVADFFVLCSADSDIQVKAIADAVHDGMVSLGSPPWKREDGSANWVILDFVDVVLHVFHKATRLYYNLEKLWGDAEISRIDEKKTPARKKKAVKGVRSTTRKKTRRKTG